MAPVEVAGFYSDSVMVESPVSGHFHEYFALGSRVMEWGALSTHHILPDTLKDKPAWDAAEFKRKRLQGVSYAVGHNVDFDMEVLGISPAEIKPICTLALSRLWLPDLDAHKLGALMYDMFGANEATRNKLRNAHTASADICMTYDWLQEAVRQFAYPGSLHPAVNWAELHALSEIGRIPVRMSFGKYGPKDGKQGKRIRDLKIEDPGYCTWLRKNCSKDTYLMKALQ